MPRFAPNKVVLWDEAAEERQQSDESQRIPSPAPAPTTAESTAASTVFDAGSAYDDASNVAASTPSLAASSRLGLAGLDGLESDDDRPSPPASMLSSTTEGLDDPFATERATSPSTPRDDAQSATDAAPTPRSRGKEVIELEFGEPVQSVCVRPFSTGPKEAPTKAALLVVVLSSKAVVFEMGQHLSIAHADTSHGAWGIALRTSIPILNDKLGLVDLVILPSQRAALLALAGRQPGHVQLLLLSLTATPSRTPISQQQPSSGLLSSTIIAAHEAAIANLTLAVNDDGVVLLATASRRGTLIRVWAISTSRSKPGAASSIKAALRSEMRRGTEQAAILNMAFSSDVTTLAAASDKGTIHFFDLRVSQPDASAAQPQASSGSSTPAEAPRGNTSGRSIQLSQSALKYIPSGLDKLASRLPSNMLPQYVKSTWSVAQFRIKLQSFAAFNSQEERIRSTRGTRGPPARADASEDGGRGSSDGPSQAPRGGAGASKSTEGAWATLKGRIEDVKRWEPALDEKIFLTWVKVGGEHHLVAMTTRGAWYRIALRYGAASAATRFDEGTGSGSGSTVLDMYKESSTPSRAPTASTSLEEYRTFGSGTDARADDE